VAHAVTDQLLARDYARWQRRVRERGPSAPLHLPVHLR
jgi:hypothetical protein